VGLDYLIGDKTDATPDNEKQSMRLTTTDRRVVDFDFGKGGIKIARCWIS